MSWLVKIIWSNFVVVSRYFFEKTATLFQHKDPKAASYCKWAARSLFRQISPWNDFPNFYYVIMALEEERKQIKAGGPISIPVRVMPLNACVLQSR
jgi:hypothetical protein